MFSDSSTYVSSHRDDAHDSDSDEPAKAACDEETGATGCSVVVVDAAVLGCCTGCGAADL